MGEKKEDKIDQERKFNPSSIGNLRRMSSIQIFVLEKRYSGEEHTEKEWDKIIIKDGF